MRSGPGEARTILLLHIISVRPSKQPLMVRTFLKVYIELGSYFLFLQEQIKDIIIWVALTVQLACTLFTPVLPVPTSKMQFASVGNTEIPFFSSISEKDVLAEQTVLLGTTKGNWYKCKVLVRTILVVSSPSLSIGPVSK